MLERPLAERRRFPRFRIPLRIELAPAETDDLVTFTCEDISIGGIRARGRLLVTTGEQVLVLVSDDSRTIPALARVIAIDVSIRDGLIGLRLRFEHLSAGARSRLERLIRETAARTGSRAAGDLRRLDLRAGDGSTVANRRRKREISAP